MVICMKKEELEHAMKGILEDAKSLLSRDGRLVPVAFICTGNEIGITPLNFKNREEKERQAMLLAEVVKLKNADALIMVAESWYVTSNDPNLKIEPSKHPMRKECICVMGECEEGNITIAQNFEREKDIDGDRIIFGDINDMNILDFSKFNFGINFGIKNRKKYDKGTLRSKINALRSNLN